MTIYNGGGPKGPLGGSRRHFVRGLALGGGALLTPGLMRAATLAGGAAALQSAAARPFATMDALKAQDPQVHAAASSVLSYLKLTIAATAAGRTPAGGAGGNPFAESTRAFIASRPARRRGVYRDACASLLAASPAERAIHFGALASVDPAVALASPSRMLSPVKPATLTLRKRLDWIAGLNITGTETPPPPKDPPSQPSPDSVAGKRYKYLEFAVNYVRCLEGTGGLLEGTDEIMAGGLIVGAKGHRKKIKPWFVGEDFGTDSDDRHTMSYWDFGGYHCGFYDMDIKEVPGNEYPHYYMAQVALSEKDDGGFGDFLSSLWDKVGSELSQALGDAAGTAIGAALGSSIPGLGTVIGVVIGAIVGWLVSLFHNEDDKVGVDHAVLKLTSWNKSYYDKLGLTTAEGHVGHVLNFTDSGHYHVGYRWRVYDEAGYQSRKKTLKLYQPAYELLEAGVDD